VLASNGIRIGATLAISQQAPDYDLVMVNSSWTPEEFQHRSAIRDTHFVHVVVGAYLPVEVCSSLRLVRWWALRFLCR
jgi:hypothetical protein